MLNLSGDFIVAAGHMSVIEVLANSPMQVWRGHGIANSLPTLNRSMLCVISGDPFHPCLGLVPPYQLGWVE